jgi:hypothetical protein
VADYIVQSAEKSCDKYEAKIIRICLWLLHIEPESLWVYVITHNDETPNPNNDFKDDKELKWDIKAFVLAEEFG